MSPLVILRSIISVSYSEILTITSKNIDMLIKTIKGELKKNKMLVVAIPIIPATREVEAE
jgi:hypothetical protein